MSFLENRTPVIENTLGAKAGDFIVIDGAWNMCVGDNNFIRMPYEERECLNCGSLSHDNKCEYCGEKR